MQLRIPSKWCLICSESARVLPNRAQVSLSALVEQVGIIVFKVLLKGGWPHHILIQVRNVLVMATRERLQLTIARHPATSLFCSKIAV